jgi:metal-responsive CopG/Arc/MetJ family transcriptional regulator
MGIVQIVIDKKLLEAADRAATETNRNRSALVRDAIKEHLQRLEARRREERDRVGYSRQRQLPLQTLAWEKEAVWPAE